MINESEFNEIKEKSNLDNRYVRIHVLFKILAIERGAKVEKNNLSILNDAARKVKAFWKNFYGIDSLTELSDSQLNDLERLVWGRIQAIKEEKKQS